MRLHKLALCLLIAFAAPNLVPYLAHADNPQPVPADGQCAVAADPGWTAQEQFVWRHVCAGTEANFNTEPGYGGDLNPKSAAGLPDSRILRSSFLETLLLKGEYRGALTRQRQRDGASDAPNAAGDQGYLPRQFAIRFR